MGWALGISGFTRDVSESLQVVYTKTLDICYNFAKVSNLIFDYTPFCGRNTPRGQWYCWV